jgi:thioredoxin-related protein
MNSKNMKKYFLVLTMTCLAFFVNAQEQVKPYNEKQDARSDIKKAIEQARREHKNVMMQFGGNWCPWCLRFHALVKGVPRLDSLMSSSYVYLLVNVAGSRDKDKRDMKLFAEYQYPNRFGFPVFVILDKEGKRLNTVDSDGFEYPDPRIKGYDTLKVERFLRMWTVRALDPGTYQTH